MPSRDVETARRLIREHGDLFDALLAFERTRRLPKLKRKTRVNFTLDSDLYRAFRSACARRGLKMSNVLEALLREKMEGWR